MNFLELPHIATTCAFLTLDSDYQWQPDDEGSGWVMYNSDLLDSTEKLGWLRPRACSRWVALGTYNCPYWNRVRHGTSWKEVPANTQILLWEEPDGNCGVLLPALCGDYVLTISGDDNGLRLTADGGNATPVRPDCTVAYAATGRDVTQLIQTAIRRLRERIGGFRLRQEKRVPKFVDYLGWCSWDAFYSNVSERKIVSAAASFQRGGVMPGFVILDDGWLSKNGDLLLSFEPDPAKFPNGLSALTSRLKQKYGICFFGIWHAFTGYWGGIDPDGELSLRYKLTRAEGIIRPWTGERQSLYLVDPADIANFFRDFHGTLQRAGVDLVKVDGQSALAEFTKESSGRVGAMQSYQRALQSSAMEHFGGGLIHCMGNGADVAYSLEQTLVFRNSDDFFPKKDSACQQKHVYANALNNLWSAHFALPDWDMFQSHHRYGEFHAAARALSGGPIYVCDKPGRQNFQILRRLAADSGRVWRCNRPALPSRESIFTDCENEEALLKIHNRAGNIGLLGFFHCSQARKRLRMAFSPSDVPDIRGKRFITYRFKEGIIAELAKDERASVKLARMEFEIVTISPVIAEWIAPIGMRDRYVGATCFGKIEGSRDGSVGVFVREAGTYLIWCQCPPRSVRMQGADLSQRYDETTGLLIVDVERTGTLRFEPGGI